MKVGDKVILIKGSYAPSPSNPFQETEFACQGIIDRIDDCSLRNFIYVLWNNEHHNCYNKEELKLVVTLNKQQLNNL